MADMADMADMANMANMANMADDLRLNLGCGQRKLAGFVNVDKYPYGEPDQLVDLERFPWPWADDSVVEVAMIHVLEHLGQDADTYLEIMKELWRVCRSGATIRIVVPHPRSDQYLNDPTHVRPVTADGLRMFSRRANREWASRGAANTPLGEILGIDLELQSTQYELDAAWRARLEKGELSQEQVLEAARTYNNVITQATHLLRVIKPSL